MAGVGGLSSLGLFLLLLLASSSAAREERSLKRAWTAVEVGEFPYLAVLQSGGSRAATTCSGSITSKSTVLTYCAKDPEKAFAGVKQLSVRGADKQERAVQKVTNHSDALSNLKICKVDDWVLNGKVKTVTLELDVESSPPYDNCVVLGFGGTTGAQKLEGQTIGASTVCTIDATDGVLYSAVDDATKDTLQLKDADLGGPAVCSDVQRGINMEFRDKKQPASACNLFVDIAKYSPWIKKQIYGGTDGTDGTDGSNSTSPSSGYSIHSYLNKYSKWKVLGFLVPTIVTFLQY